MPDQLRRVPLEKQAVVRAIGTALVRASTEANCDLIEAYRKARSLESNEVAQWVFDNLIENAACARDLQAVVCDDTGTPHVYVELGLARCLPGRFLVWIEEALREAMDSLPTRPMSVLGNDEERVAQSAGLSPSPGALQPAPFAIDIVPGDALRVTILMLGGGPELRSKTYRVFHERSLETVLGETAEWAAEAMPKLGCTPATLAVGIGRTHYEATQLMLRAMVNGSLANQSEWETSLTRRVNRIGTGALGTGGKTTVLGSFIRVGPQRASGFRIVCMRPCCCVEPRKSTVVF